jgi:transcriptional regulator with XRE-family HTH domain
MMDRDIWINIGKRLRIARGGLSLRQSAVAIGISHQAIRNHERGLVPLGTERLKQYIDAYDTTWLFLLHAGAPLELTPAPWGLFVRRRVSDE